MSNDPTLLACWYSDIGALNQILIIRTIKDPTANLESRMAMLKSKDPFGVDEFSTGMTMDTFVAFDFLPPMQPGSVGPCFEVRSYILKGGGSGADDRTLAQGRSCPQPNFSCSHGDDIGHRRGHPIHPYLAIQIARRTRTFARQSRG